MADMSPGKVQMLRAMFAEKDSPIMGMLPTPNRKPILHPKPSPTPHCEDSPLSKSGLTTEMPKTLNAIQQEKFKYSYDVPPKPAVGPKPLFIKQQSALALNKNVLQHAQKLNRTEHLQQQRPISDSSVRSTNCDSIALFMFSDSENCKSDAVNNNDLKPSVPISDCVPGTNSQLDNSKMLPLFNKDMIKKQFDSHVINSENYICKNTCKFVRNDLPSVETLESPPVKPPKPTHMSLPKSCHSQKKLPPSKPPRSKVQRPTDTSMNVVKSAYPYFLQPATSLLNPSVMSEPHSFDLTSSSGEKSLLQEIEEELYEDTSVARRPVSLIPEYTTEEEDAELYDDAEDVQNLNYPTKPKHPPPLPPGHHLMTEELYQDADEPTMDEIYEEMHEENGEEEQELYINNRKEIEKLKRDKEKRLRKETKEKEKREKEFDKIKKKFGVTGEELPIDAGLVKSDIRGGKCDLSVKKGEIVQILRIEGNPPGKWLVKNIQGKYGYVELTNIEVDPDSVKIVMSTRSSVISTSDELYSEAYSEEAIYEVTY